MTCRDEEIDCIEPDRQRCSAILKDRASAGIHMVATVRTRERAAISKLVECAFNTALSAVVPLTMANLHDVGQAGVIVREPSKEFPHCELTQFVERLGHDHPLR